MSSSSDPKDAPEPAADAEPDAPAERGTLAFLRTNLPPAAGVGVLMGLLAAKEESGAGVALVVAVAGCALVLGMLALKRALHGP
ncbi:MAG TPA: hypothetical protein VH372_10865 [Actinospica sp.]|jgi:hypothetical protein|nr:hypothetical protein [Actinospica sp.]